MFSGNILVENNNSFIQELLLQEGLPFWITGNLDTDSRIPSLWILNDADPDGHKLSKIKQLVKTGNIVLCDQKTSRCLKPEITSNIYASDTGGLVVLPFSYDDFVDNFTLVEKIFKTQAGIEVKERVALKNRGIPRRELSGIIKEIFFQKGIPYVHLWYYPHGYDSIFSFKIDLDEYNKTDIENLADYGRDFSDSITWFVCCSIIEKDIRLIKKLQQSDYDIQSHGYFHHIYKDSADNSLNISRSVDLLKRLGVKTRGFSGPMGKWNSSLMHSLNILGVEYSSEFGFDYDNLPSYPVSRLLKNTALQIPVHPLCLGSFIESDVKDKAGEYFDKLIEYKYLNKEPVFLYGHPEERLGKNKEFFTGLMKKAYSLSSVKKMNFSGICEWWKKRRKHEFCISTADFSKISLSGENADTSFCYRIEMPDKKEAFISATEKEINLNNLKFTAISGKECFYNESILMPALKTKIKEFIDWEEITPIPEIRKNNIEGLMKYYLRRIKNRRAGISEKVENADI